MTNVRNAAPPGIGHCRHAVFMADARLYLLVAIVPGELAIAVEQFFLLPVIAFWQLEVGTSTTAEILAVPLCHGT